MLLNWIKRVFSRTDPEVEMSVMLNISGTCAVCGDIIEFEDEGHEPQYLDTGQDNVSVQYHLKPVPCARCLASATERATVNGFEQGRALFDGD